MELKPTYNRFGEKRAYYEGEDGKEYFMYQDEKTGYTIRQMNKDDVIPWYEAMKTNGKQKKSPIERAIILAKVTQKVEKMAEEESIEKTMLVLNSNNQIIGELDFTENEAGKGDLEIYLKDEKIVKFKGTQIVELIKRMNTSERLYDQIWMGSIDQDSIRMI